MASTTSTRIDPWSSQWVVFLAQLVSACVATNKPSRLLVSAVNNAWISGFNHWKSDRLRLANDLDNPNFGQPAQRATASKTASGHPGCREADLRGARQA